MHTKVVYQARQSARADRVRRAALQFSRRRARARAISTSGRGEHDDFRAAARFHAGRYPDAPLWAAGMSFGAWVALTTGADDQRCPPDRHRDAASRRYDFATCETSPKPKFFIHGERDELCPLKAVREFYARCRGAERARRDRRSGSPVRRQSERGRRRDRGFARLDFSGMRPIRQNTPRGGEWLLRLRQPADVFTPESSPTSIG